MKTLFLAIILTLVFGSVLTAEAKDNAPIKVRVGRQKKFAVGNITVKFISMEEDSRCPVGVNCVWAGNARIKVQISEGGKSAENFEMNTTLGARGASFHNYAINLDALSPAPKDGVKVSKDSYTATFTINRLTR